VLEKRGRRSRACETVAEDIRRRIKEGIFPVNSYLPPERKLAEECGYSRPTISAAINLLAKDGVVMRAPGRSALVLPQRDPPARPELAVLYNVAGRASLSEEGQVIFEGIQDTLSRNAYRFTLVPLITEGDLLSPRSERSVAVKDVPSLVGRFGAFLFIEGTDAIEEILSIQSRRVPVVVANLEQPDVETCSTWVDHRKTTMEAVNILASMGHKRIAYIGTDPQYNFYAKTLDGFRQGMARAGLVVDEGLVAICIKTDSFPAYILAREFFKRAEPPTGIVCARDEHAGGACQAATEAGRVVGRDVSIIGFGALGDWAADPVLTTFREPAYELGAGAAEMLIDQVTNGWRPPERREFEPRLLLRRSVGPLLEPHP